MDVQAEDSSAAAMEKAVTATGKWRGTASGVVSAPVARVWELVSTTSRLREWVPMMESCAAVAGDEGVPGYVRLVSGGLMFPQQLQLHQPSPRGSESDDDHHQQQQQPSSWIRERLVAMDHAARSYTYLMEDGIVGLAGSRNTISVSDYGDGATLVVWSFEVEPVDGANQDALLDYLRILYKSCIHNIPLACRASASPLHSII